MTRNRRADIPEEVSVRARFQKVYGVVICSTCRRFLGPPSYSNGVVNEAKVHARSCPVCGADKGKLIGYAYTGKCRVTITDPVYGRFSGSAKCQPPDEFKTEIGYRIALGRALASRREAVAASEASKKKPENECVFCRRIVPGKIVAECKARGIAPIHSQCEKELAEQLDGAAHTAEFAEEPAATTPTLGTGEDLAKLLETILGRSFPGIKFDGISIDGKKIYNGSSEKPEAEQPLTVDRILELLGQLRDGQKTLGPIAVPGTPRVPSTWPLDHRYVPPTFPGTTPLPGTLPWTPTVICRTSDGQTQTARLSVAGLENMLSNMFGQEVHVSRIE